MRLSNSFENTNKFGVKSVFRLWDLLFRNYCSIATDNCLNSPDVQGPKRVTIQIDSTFKISWLLCNST